MNDHACPACKADNDEDAAYCDQCGQHLNAPEGADALAEHDACPACGGLVESRGDGKGVCAGCGLELVETPEEPAAKADSHTVARLTAAILRRAAAGQNVEQAVAEACREVLTSPGGDEPAAASPEEEEAPEPAEPCPLCGEKAGAGAAQCSACGLWLRETRSAKPCPRCDRAVSGGKCECGAILTLARLMDYIEPSVRFVCRGCKQPYAVFQAKCPDCGGGLLSADRLKAYGEISGPR